MTVVELLALALAVSAVVDVWFNGEPPFLLELRSYFEARDGAAPPLDDDLPLDPDVTVTRPLWSRLLDWIVPNWMVGAFTCPYCFSHHVAFWLVAICYLPTLFLRHPWQPLFWSPIYLLAAIRLSVLLDAAVPAGAKHRRYKDLIQDD